MQERKSLPCRHETLDQRQDAYVFYNTPMHLHLLDQVTSQCCKRTCVHIECVLACSLHAYLCVYNRYLASVLACILNVYLHAHCMRTCVCITGIFKRNVFPDHTNWHTRSCCISSTGLTGRKTLRTSNCSNCCTFVFAVGTAHHVCRYPIIKAIHLKLTNDRRRFAKVINPAFEEWFQLLRDKPELQKFMQDGGEGKPPAEYLWKVEKGLRNLGRMSVSLYLTNLC